MSLEMSDTAGLSMFSAAVNNITAHFAANLALVCRLKQMEGTERDREAETHSE